MMEITWFMVCESGSMQSCLRWWGGGSGLLQPSKHQQLLSKTQQAVLAVNKRAPILLYGSKMESWTYGYDSPRQHFLGGICWGWTTHPLIQPAHNLEGTQKGNLRRSSVSLMILACQRFILHTPEHVTVISPQSTFLGAPTWGGG